MRRTILRLLVPGPRSVGAIAEDLPVSRPAVSKHLRVLVDAGLVGTSRHGTQTLVRLERAGFDAARAWLDAFWDEALERFASIAEARS
jgi:DNA-binding transcriptional ArsR family regulator